MKVKQKLEIFDLDGNGNHLLCKAKINNCDGILIVDTGASQTVLSANSEAVKSAIEFINHNQFIEYKESSNLAAKFTADELTEMGVGDDGVLSLAANGQAIEFQFGIVDCIQIGELRIEKMPTGLIDFTSINNLYSKMQDTEVFGLLGSDILQTYKAKIDYGKKQITFKMKKN